MIAPWCEAESTEKIVVDLGQEAPDFWLRKCPVAERRGCARPRDKSKLIQFSRRTKNFVTLGYEPINRIPKSGLG
jgi:glycine oxidase